LLASRFQTRSNRRDSSWQQLARARGELRVQPAFGRLSGLGDNTESQWSAPLRGLVGVSHVSGKETIMPKFVIEREIPGASSMTEAQIREASLKSIEALREMGNGIQWLHSFITDDKIYCVYFASDESLIIEHGRRAGLPVDRIAAVRRLIDPSNFQ
jgi:hypothetical protein